ncbi:MAG: hypothetical protein AAF434_02960 [Pseudomonadota bacterium]
MPSTFCTNLNASRLAIILFASGAAYVFSHSSMAETGSLTMRLAKATALVSANNTEGARDLLEAITEEYPDSPEAFNNLAVLAAYSEDWSEAIALLQKALATDKRMNTSYQNLNQIYRYQAALAYRAALVDSDDTPLPLPDLTMLQAPTEDKKIDIAANSAPPAAVEQPADLPDEGELVATVQNWARAWSSQDVQRYLDSYTSDYQPDINIDHDTWRSTRRNRVSAPAFIEVTLRDEVVEVLSSDRAIVTFTQSYRSPTFNDSVRKLIVLNQTEQGWRIAREHVIR